MIDERLAVHIDSMKKAVVKAMSIVNGMSEEEFKKDENLQAAAAMFLVVVGEAAIKISQRHPEFVTAHADWPWDLMRGMRNRIVHSYDTLHIPTIWSTAVLSLPALLANIEALGPLDPRETPPPQTGT